MIATDTPGTTTRETMVDVYGGFALVDWIGYPVATVTGPRCGSCTAHHNSVAAIKLCYSIAEDQAQQAEDEAAAERAYERHLEDRGYDEARAQEAYEAAHGVIPFDVALAAAYRDLEATATR